MPINKTALFCPMLMACKTLEPRWTMVILSEMWCGSTRFNDIRRGVPGISPGAAQQAAQGMGAHGLVGRVEHPATGTVDYLRAEATRELEPILNALGKWAYRHVEAEDQLCWLDPKFFLWNVRRAIDTEALPARRVVLKFNYPELEKSPRDFWIVTRPRGRTDVCFIDPGLDVDLYITAELRALVAVYFGRARLGDELQAGRIKLIGPVALERSFTEWFVLSSYAQAGQEKLETEAADNCPASSDKFANQLRRSSPLVEHCEAARMAPLRSPR